MKLLLVPPSPLMYSEIYLRLEPLGLERVAGAARQSGHEVRILDLQTSTHAELSRELATFGPRAVGFSLNYLANLPEVVDLAKRIKGQIAAVSCLWAGTAPPSSAPAIFHRRARPPRVDRVHPGLPPDLTLSNCLFYVAPTVQRSFSVYKYILGFAKF